MLKRLLRPQFALAAALACVGCAAPTGGDSNQTFKSVDTDGNGTLSPQEVQSALDANSDGEISNQEWNQLAIDPADD